MNILRKLKRKQQPYHVLAATDPTHGNHIAGVLKENIEALGGTFHGNELPGNDWVDQYIGFRIGEFAARFQLQQMPGCCAMMTLSFVQTFPESQKNFNTVAELVGQAAREAKFALVMMTQVVHTDRPLIDEPWGLCLNVYGGDWELSKSYFNAKSGNLVATLIKDLKQTKKVGA